MPLAGYVTILGVVLVALALVIYLIAIIGVLREIDGQVSTTVGAVLKIVHQTRPVELVLVAIATDLTAGKNVLVGLLESKVGRQAAASAMANALVAAPAATSTAPPTPSPGDAPSSAPGVLRPTSAEFPGVAGPSAAAAATMPAAAAAPAPAAAEPDATPRLSPRSAEFPSTPPPVSGGAAPAPAAAPADDAADEPARIVYRRTIQ